MYVKYYIQLQVLKQRAISVIWIQTLGSVSCLRGATGGQRAGSEKSKNFLSLQQYFLIYSLVVIWNRQIDTYHCCYWLWGKSPYFGQFLNSFSQGKLLKAHFCVVAKADFSHKPHTILYQQCTLQQAKTKFPLGRSFWELWSGQLTDWDWLKLAQKPCESGGWKGKLC